MLAWVALAAAAFVIGRAGAVPAAMVDCKAANDDCNVCTSMEYCQFVVTKAGALSEVSACIHWQDDDRMGRLLGQLQVPAAQDGSAMLSSSVAGLPELGKRSEDTFMTHRGSRLLVMDYGGSWDSVLKSVAALCLRFSAQGPSCPASWPPSAPWDIPSTVWEPVHGPGDKGSLEEDAKPDARFSSAGMAGEREAGQGEDLEAAGSGEEGRAGSLRLGSDAVPRVLGRRRHRLTLGSRKSVRG